MMSRTTTVVFVVTSSAVFGLLVLVRPQPLNQQAVALAHDGILHIEASRDGPKWRYIVIHHSKTLGGTGPMFDRYYREAWRQQLGMGWHFLVQREAVDGANLIYTGRRWREQADGFHTFNRYDRDSIGVCVAGLMRTTGPTDEQFEALVWLVRRLQAGYKIPAQRVLLHRDVDSDSRCPGPAFPADRFRRELLHDLP